MSQTSQRELTVVMPAYNEEAAIEQAVEDVRQHVFPLVPEAELVVINDGSRDRTGPLLDKIAQKDGRIRVIHQANGGHGKALRTGLDAAKGKYVFLIDSDRQIPLEEFRRLWPLANHRDGAFGQRIKRHDPKIRLALTAVVRFVLRMLFRVKLYDANVPFKVLRRDVWLDARHLIPPDTLAPSLFLAAYARKRGCDIAEVPVEHAERKTGVVSIRRWKLFKFCARAFRQLLSFRSRLSHVS